MKSLLLSAHCILLLLTGACASESQTRFIDSAGAFDIPLLEEKIEVTHVGDLIQFRIRGTGPKDPIIISGDQWFIAMVDKDHFWVHLGKGRLFYFTWQANNHSRVDEWTYPNLGSEKLPVDVEERLRKQ